MLALQRHHPWYRYFEIYRYYEIRNYENSLYQEMSLKLTLTLIMMIGSAFGGLKLNPILDFSESFSNYMRIEYKSCPLRQPFDLSTDFETRLKHWRIFFRGEDLSLEGRNQLLAIYLDEIWDIITVFQNPQLINGSSFLS